MKKVISKSFIKKCTYKLGVTVKSFRELATLTAEQQNELFERGE